MSVLVTGGTGFIGNHVIHELLSRKKQVIVTGRNLSKAKDFDWFKKVQFVEFDLSNSNSMIPKTALSSIDAVIHLAWEGLPNYEGLFHFEKNLMPQYFFLKKLINSGITNITVSGTCFEYGMKEGCLSPNMPTDPQNPYAIAKDTLRQFLQQLQIKQEFDLKWVRLFYMYGKGQSEKSILSQLDSALEKGHTVFNMSGGEQLRDYLPVEEVAKILVAFSQDKNTSGVFNCCSGQPISIRKLVENHLKNKGKSISLNLGYYPYPAYAPMAFWGSKKNSENE